MSKRTSVGGQAVIEGVMMRGPSKVAVAVRKPDGEIDVKVEDCIPLSKKNKFLSFPFIRGTASLIDSLVVGIRTLSYSASFYEDEEESRFDKFIKKIFGEKADNIIMAITLFVSFAFAIGLFFLLPTFFANHIAGYISKNSIIKNLIEGAIRLVIFFIYLYLISLMNDIKRVFEYHGAEHKSIFCYEAGLPLNAENAARFSTHHPRCGTNFLLIVMIISIIVYSFAGWPNLALRVVLRVVLLPVIAGISYELLKWQGRSESRLADFLAYPGLALQSLTTRQPDASQLEVAIEALKAVIPDEADNKDEVV